MSFQSKTLKKLIRLCDFISCFFTQSCCFIPIISHIRPYSDQTRHCDGPPSSDQPTGWEAERRPGKLLSGAWSKIKRFFPRYERYFDLWASQSARRLICIWTAPRDFSGFIGTNASNSDRRSSQVLWPLRTLSSEPGAARLGFGPANILALTAASLLTFNGQLLFYFYHLLAAQTCCHPWCGLSQTWIRIRPG